MNTKQKQINDRAAAALSNERALSDGWQERSLLDNIDVVLAEREGFLAEFRAIRDLPSSYDLGTNPIAKAAWMIALRALGEA